LSARQPTNSEIKNFVFHHADTKPEDFLVTNFSNHAIVSAISSLLDFDCRNNTNLVRKLIYPQKNGMPTASVNGKYFVKLFVNGTFRKVVVDDTIILDSQTSQPISLTTFQNKAIWPSIVEKAVYKIYNCESMCLKTNPSLEVYHLSGWLPEKIALKDISDKAKLWGRLKENFEDGNVILSIGGEDGYFHSIVRFEGGEYEQEYD
jgi:calpain-7